MSSTISPLKKHCNKEIFLAYNSEKNEAEIPTEFYITTNLMALVEYLKKLVPSLDYDTKIIHGILTDSSSLPKNLRGKTAFLVLEDAYDMDSILVIESGAESDKELASKIDSLLTNNELDLIAPAIVDDIYILYGYELSTILSLNEEELDEEVIDTCQKIANDAHAIKTLNGPGDDNE